MTRPSNTMEQHPDIAELRARYDRVAETSAAQSVDGLTLLAGVYLAISPWVIGFRATEPDMAVNNLICGITVALLGLGYATVYGRTHGLSWVPVVLGIWTIVSPFVIRGTAVSGGTIANNIIIGAVITLLGLVTLGIARRRS
jgi:hypothetical protein